MTEKKDNDLIESRRKELNELHEFNKMSLDDNHKIKNIPLNKLNKNGEQKLLTINETKWSKKDLRIKIAGIVLTILIISILIVLAYLIGEGNQ